MILTQADITLINYMKIHIHLIWFLSAQAETQILQSQFPGFLSADALQRLLLAVLNHILGSDPAAVVSRGWFVLGGDLPAGSGLVSSSCWFEFV